MPRDYLVLTGCTGLIGRYLLRDLLIKEVPVAVISRASQRSSLEKRIEEIVCGWEHSLARELGRPVCIEGDLHQRGLGVNSSDRSWLSKNAGSVLHNAASVSFFDSGDGEPWRTNVDGVREMIMLCKETGIDSMHYMSTAFVCGNRTGTIREDELDCGQGFQSDYERSKFTAEQLLRDAGFSSLTVLRPSAVVGDSQTGFTSTYHGFYLYAQFTYLAQQRAGAQRGEQWNHPVRLFSTGDEHHCLVPVDWVAAATSEIVCRPELHGRTYHLTPSTPTSQFEAEAALRTYFNYEGVSFVGPGDGGAEPRNDIEELFYSAISSGEHLHWAGHPRFCSAATQQALPHLPCPRVDVDLLKRLIDFAVTDGFGRRQRKSARRARVAAPKKSAVTGGRTPLSSVYEAADQ